MRFGVLGVLEVHTDRGEPVRVPELKVRALLAALLAAEGEVVSADRLVEDLWDARRPADPRAALQTRVSQLRRALEDAEPGARALVVSEGPGYALRGASGAVDAERVTALLARARDTADPAGRVAVLDDALALWRGPAFADAADAGFVRPAAARLDALRLAVLEERAEARLDAGPPTGFETELEALVDEHPLRERLRAALMRALYAAGRPQEALATYRDLKARLRDELGTDPGPDLAALERSILNHDLAQRPGASAPVPLPTPLTELVGRREDLARVDAALDADRLVTLVGPGGVGKTRLALAVAHARTDRHRDGVRLVELDRRSPDTDAAGVATAVAAACGLRSAATSGARGPTSPDGLGEALRERDLLLVLDNTEHVLTGAGEVVRDLLAHAPGVRLLLTSREPLEVPGEALVPVDPLEGADAVDLFLARVRAADPDAEDADDLEAVAAVCRQLDGIPLALELAAARVRAFGVHGLLERLDDRFAVLARTARAAGPERQRTLRAALDWSWELLSDDEAAAMRRLAPCVGGFTLATAEELVGGEPDVPDTVARLVDRSWLVADGRGRCRRFRMLESTAAYAAERLVSSGSEGAARDRHLALHLALLERADPQLRGREQRAWLEALDAETANLAAALDRAATTGDAASALLLVDRAAWYWFLRGRVDVALRACDTALAVPGADAHPGLDAAVRAWRDALAIWSNTGTPVDPAPRPAATARARWFDVFARWGVSAPGQAVARLADVLAELRAAGDTWGTAAALVTRASFGLITDDVVAARRDAERAGVLFDELGDRWGHLQVESTLGALAIVQGDHEEARTRNESALRVAEDLGLLAESAGLLGSLGRVALAAGDFASSWEQHTRARDLARAHGHRELVDFAEFGLALTARRRGDLDTAERMVLVWLENRPREDAFRAVPYSELGFVAELRGDVEGALAHHREAHRVAEEWDSPRTIALALEGLAGARSLAGDAEDAARLLGAASVLRARARAPLGAGERGDVDRIRARVRDALGVAAADEAEAAGTTRRPGQGL